MCLWLLTCCHHSIKCNTGELYTAITINQQDIIMKKIARRGSRAKRTKPCQAWNRDTVCLLPSIKSKSSIHMAKYTLLSYLLLQHIYIVSDRYIRIVYKVPSEFATSTRWDWSPSRIHPLPRLYSTGISALHLPPRLD